MTETIITESGELIIEETQPSIKTHMAIVLKRIIQQIDLAEKSLVDNQNKLDRICSQLTNEQWVTLAVTQITIIATRNTSAADYLLATKT